MHLLRREIDKKRRHIPIRQLIKKAGGALQEFKPCFMMGPFSMAQYLEQVAIKTESVRKLPNHLTGKRASNITPPIWGIGFSNNRKWI